MDNTVILFVSDHGEMLGDHLMFQKAKPFQGSIHVPLFISGPERYIGKRGTVRTDLAELRDGVAVINNAVRAVGSGLADAVVHEMAGELGRRASAVGQTPDDAPAVARLQKVLLGVAFAVAVEAAAFAAPSPIKALPISKPRKANNASDSIEPGERKVFFSPDVPDIPCNNTSDLLFPAVFCKISCDLVQIVRY